MKQITSILFLLLLTIFFTACGGSSTNTTQNTAIDKLIAYANSKGTSSTPTLQDYLDAGVIGVNSEEKLAEINQVISRLTAEDVDTTEEVQDLADSLIVEVPEGTVLTPSKPKPDTTPPVIIVIGDNALNVVQFTPYTEEGATAEDNKDGTVSVNVSGTVNTDVVGVYAITYTATDSADNSAIATRTVTVTQAPDTTPPVITLNGASALNVVQFTSYTEEGAIADDVRDGSVSVNISGTVNIDVVGVYTLTYTSIDSAGNTATATRTVTVTRAPDTTAPVITLNGGSAVDVVLNQSYIELNATANDDRDGSVTVTITGSVDIATVGDYTITYTASDAAGNTATATRTVSVISRWSRDDVKEIVIDHLDGYMWQDNFQIIFLNWQGAIDYCSNTLTLGGYRDWILPDIIRLRTLVDNNRQYPAMNPIFIHTINDWTWTSTPSTVLTDAWTVEFSLDGAGYKYPKYRLFLFRCVRKM